MADSNSCWAVIVVRKYNLHIHGRFDVESIMIVTGHNTTTALKENKFIFKKFSLIKDLFLTDCVGLDQSG